MNLYQKVFILPKLYPFKMDLPSSFLKMVKKTAKTVESQQKNHYLSLIEKNIGQTEFIDWSINQGIPVKFSDDWPQMKIKIINSGLLALKLKDFYEQKLKEKKASQINAESSPITKSKQEKPNITGLCGVTKAGEEYARRFKKTLENKDYWAEKIEEMKKTESETQSQALIFDWNTQKVKREMRYKKKP